MTYLDSFAGLEELLSQYQESYRRLRELQRQLGDFLTDEGEKARQLDLLQFQIQEIEEAGVRPGEREELSAQRDKIRNSEKIAEGVSLAKALLTGGRGPGRDSLRAGPGRRRAGAGGALPAGRGGLRPETPGGPVRP